MSMVQQQHTDQFLLTTKLSIPHIHAGLVARPRLFEQLQMGMQQPLTLLAAPAGFGKTMLLSAWIQQSKRPVSWVSLDSNDNDPTQFWAYVITALDKLHPGIGKAPLTLLQSAQPAPIETVLIALVNALSTFHQDIALVLDDYHVIEASPIHNAMAFLLDHLPTTVHLIIASRVDPPLPLGRLRVRRQMNELRADDLRFTPEEAATFLNEAMGLKLTAHDIAALETRTEGWIAGLQLAALSMQGKRDIASFVTAFTGSHRYIVDYLTEEVLHQQPEAVRTFLLQTSILDRMCGPLCDAVTGQTKSQKILEQLEHTNLFLIPLDDERHWYRYHQLFADVLRYRLTQSQSDLIPTLHKRASAWFEHNQLIVEAVNHALAAKDFEDAARLANLISNSLIQRGEYVTLLRWLEANPEDVLRTHPLLCLQYAWILLFTGQIEAYERPLGMAEQRWLAEGNTAMLGRVSHFRMNMARLQGDATRTLALAREALSLLPENDLYNRSSCLVAIGASHLLLGQLSEAQQYLTEGRALNPAPVNLITVLLATNLLGDLQVVRGNLHEAVAIYQDVLRRADERPIWQVAEAHIGLGNIFREWNKLEDATQSLQQALALAQQTWREVYLAPGYIVFAHILEARGQLAQAHENLAKAVEVAQRLGHLPALRRAKAQQARLHLAQGNLALAEQWSEAAGILGDEELNYEHEIEYLVLARLRFAQNRADNALRLLGRLLTADEAAGRIGHVIQNLALQVIARQAVGDAALAMKTLERALSLAEPQDYIRVFVDEGVSMREVVSRFLALSTQPSRTLGKSVSREYVQKLLAAFPQTETKQIAAHVGARATEQSSTTSSLIEPLSIREQEVLELLAAGMSNQEIARHLVVTEGTVKTHIKSIYGKFGVHSRTQAVARARELSLL